MVRRAFQNCRRAAAVLLVATLSVMLINATPASAADSEDFKQFEMVFQLGGHSNTNSCIPAWVTARYRDSTGSDTWTRLVRTNTDGCESDWEHLQTWGDFQTPWMTVTLRGGPKPAQHLYWRDLTSLTLHVATPNTPPGRQKNIEIDSWFIRALDTNNNWHVLYNEKYRYEYGDGHNDHELYVYH
jgi:hypothetical protein